MVTVRPYKNRHTGATVYAAPIGTTRGEPTYAVTDSRLNAYAFDNYNRGMGQGIKTGFWVGIGITALVAWVISLVDKDDHKKEEKEGK